MAKDFKLLLASLGFTFLLIALFAVWQGGRQTAVLSEVQGVEISPQPSDWGQVSYGGGEVMREYELKNALSQGIKVKKLATNCMCTEAKIVVGGNQSRFFGMEHPGDSNPPINFEIGAGETAKVVVKFDPAAHGPEGIGPFERTVLLTLADPVGTKELNFSGSVVSD